MSAQPAQKPGKSRQDYETPDDLLSAVRAHFGPPSWDLAASAANAKAPDFIDEARDSLTVDWYKLGGLLWLNPPFGSITAWAAKCRLESRKGARVLLLTPASVGSNWYRDHVHGEADVLFLNPRVTFVGETTPYPKDCMISAFGFGVVGCSVWGWRRNERSQRLAA